MRVLTIGTSQITENFIRACQQVDGVKVTSVYSRQKEKGIQFAEKMNVEFVYDDLELALKGESFDSVYVASPNSLHFTHCHQALMADKHVICEKPFVNTSQELQILIELAHTKGLILMEAITTLFMPNFKIVQEKLNQLGEIKLIQCNYSQYSSRYTLYKDKVVTNIFDPHFKGGALRDINVYNIHFVVSLMGMPDEVHYYANRGFNQIDTSGILVLDYPNFKAVCTGAKDSASESFVYIQGELKTIKVHGSSVGLCQAVSLFENDTETLISRPQKMHMVYEVEAFRDMIKERQLDKRDQYLTHSLKVLKVLEEAEKYD